jgi:Domain of unknown function (DUF4158)
MPASARPLGVYRPFTIAEYRRLREWLTDLALQTNKALALAEQLIESLRSQRIIVPAVTMIDRLCAEALARGVKLLYQRLTQSLDGDGCAKLDALLGYEHVRVVGTECALLVGEQRCEQPSASRASQNWGRCGAGKPAGGVSRCISGLWRNSGDRSGQRDGGIARTILRRS